MCQSAEKKWVKFSLSTNYNTKYHNDYYMNKTVFDCACTMRACVWGSSKIKPDKLDGLEGRFAFCRLGLYLVYVFLLLLLLNDESFEIVDTHFGFITLIVNNNNIPFYFVFSLFFLCMVGIIFFTQWNPSTVLLHQYALHTSSVFAILNFNGKPSTTFNTHKNNNK